MIKKIVLIICCERLSGDLHKQCGHDDMIVIKMIKNIIFIIGGLKVLND